MDMFLYERVSCVYPCLSDEPVLFCQYLARATDVSICTVTEICVLYTTKKDESV